LVRMEALGNTALLRQSRINNQLPAPQ